MKNNDVPFLSYVVIPRPPYTLGWVSFVKTTSNRQSREHLNFQSCIPRTVYLEEKVFTGTIEK